MALPRAFAKLHGLGNDFVLVDARESVPGDGRLADLARLLCDRHRGVGGDGLILLTAPTAGADLGMRMLNPDGSEAEMCGNGIRCLAGFARSVTASIPESFTVETRAGRLRARLVGGEDERGCGTVEVDMGAPRFTPASSELEVDGHQYEVTCVSMGNPHCVIFLDAQAGTPLEGRTLDEIPLSELGPRFERHPAFPARTNVEFAELVGRDEIAVRVWERGAGATLACGTGACAAMVAGHRTGRVGRRAQVHLPGGTLQVDWSEGRSVLMTGPYQWVFCGELDDRFPGGCRNTHRVVSEKWGRPPMSSGKR